MSFSGRNKRKPFGSNAANRLPNSFQTKANHNARHSMEPSSTKELVHVSKIQILRPENRRENVGKISSPMIRPQLRGEKENNPTRAIRHDSKTPKTANLASAAAENDGKRYPSEKNLSRNCTKNPLKKPDPRQSPKRDPSPLKRPDPLTNLDGGLLPQKRRNINKDDPRSKHYQKDSKKSNEINKSSLRYRTMSDKSTRCDPEGRNGQNIPSTYRSSRPLRNTLSETSDMDTTCSSPNKIETVKNTSRSNDDNDGGRGFGVSSNVENLEGDSNACSNNVP